MQDSVISWVKVPLKHLLNLVLSDTRQHQVNFGVGFCYRFSSHMQTYCFYHICPLSTVSGPFFVHSPYKCGFKSKLLIDGGSISDK